MYWETVYSFGNSIPDTLHLRELFNILESRLGWRWVVATLLSIIGLDTDCIQPTSPSGSKLRSSRLNLSYETCLLFWSLYSIGAW